MSRSSCHDLDIGKFQKLLSSSRFSSSSPKKHLLGKVSELSLLMFLWLFCFPLSLQKLQLCWCHPGCSQTVPCSKLREVSGAGQPGRCDR